MADQVRAAHILLMYAGSERSNVDRSREEAWAEMEQIKDHLHEGADFGKLAQEHSDCPSAARGGDLGQFSRGSMVPEFEEAAFSLPVGGISDIVETAFGYHLIKRTA